MKKLAGQVKPHLVGQTVLTGASGSISYPPPAPLSVILVINSNTEDLLLVLPSLICWFTLVRAQTHFCVLCLEYLFMNIFFTL